MPERHYSLPDLRLVAIRAYILAQQYYAPSDRIREMPPLSDVDRLVAEIDAEKAKAGQD